MSSRSSGASLGLAVAVSVAFAVLGCASTPDRLRAKFADERTCPKEQVHVTEMGANVYRVTGCSDSVEYVCATFASSGMLPCEERGGIKNAPSGAPTRSPGSQDHQQPPGPSY